MNNKNFIDEKIIKSMKNQMIPSDDAVNSLLEKIAVLQSSPQDITTDNSYNFDEFKFVNIDRTKVTSSFPKKVLYYGTTMVAAVVLMVATVSMLGDNPNKPKEVITSITKDPNSIVFQVGSEDPSEDPTSIKDENNNTSDDKPEKKHSNKNNDDKKPFVKNNNNSQKSTSNKDNKKGSTNSKPDKNGNSVEVPTGTNPSKPVITLTPNKPNNSSNKSWSKEILAETAFSNLVIAGDNYAVPTISSNIVTTSKVANISLKVQEKKSKDEGEKIDATVKKIKNVSKEFMVAVDVEGYEDDLLYVNNDYQPESLGQFASDASLISTSTSREKVIIKGYNLGHSSYKKAKISNLDSLIKNMLLSKKDAPLVSNELYTSGDSFIIFKAKHLMAGLNVNFGVSNKGYVYIKILNKGYTFNIGEENATAFIDEIYKQI